MDRSTRLRSAPQSSAPSLPPGRRLPTLSVVIPACSARPCLRRTLTSLLSGAPAQLEVIVADDGSPAATAELTGAPEAADRRVRIIHQHQALTAAARTAGLAAAAGEYVGFADARAELTAGWAQVLLRAAARRPAIVKGEARVWCAGRELPAPRSCVAMAQHTPLHWFGELESAIYRRDFVQEQGLQFAAVGCDDLIFQVHAVVAAIVAGERIALRPRAVHRYLRRPEDLTPAAPGRVEAAGALHTYTVLHELFVRHGLSLPPAGVGFQYGLWTDRLFALTRRAAHPDDAAAANALAQRLVLECPLPEEYEQQRVARVYAVGDG